MARLLSKDIKRKLILFFVPSIASFLIYCIYKSCKKKYVFPNSIPDGAKIFVAWHDSLAIAPYLYGAMNLKDIMHVVVSKHYDGDFAIKMSKRFPFKFIRGSTKKGGIEAFRLSMKALKNNNSVLITPDGPRGPRHSVSDGVIKLAQLNSSWVVSIGWKSDRCWEFNSWDKFRIPKPFSNITLHMSEAFRIDFDNISDPKKVIHDSLNNL